MFNTHNSDRRLARDDRAVSEVIGAILIFALLMLLLVLVQVNGVPAANKQVEFEHNQRVTQDFQGLQDGLFQVATTGSEASVSVETGIVYPSRFFLLNPGPSTGMFETTQIEDPAAPNLVIRNARATDSEIDDYWDGTTDQTFRTRGLSYRPDYNELPNPGTLAWEHSVLYTRYDDGSIGVEDPTGFLSGNKIELTLLEGNISRSAIATSLPLSSISTRQRTITVTGNSPDPLTITVASDLNASEWQTEVYPPGSNQNIQAISDNPDGTVTFELNPTEDYQLSIANVRIGSSQPTQPAARYITDASEFDRSIAEGTTRRIVVEVRDRYNNPVSGVDVQADRALGAGETSDPSIDLGPEPTVDPVRTDENGQAVVEYTAPEVSDVESRTFTVTAWFGAATDSADATESEKISFDMTVQNADRSGIDNPTTPNDGQAGAGQGGDSTWRPGDTDERFTLPNGVWRNISPNGTVNHIYLSNATRVPISECSGTSRPGGGSNCNVDTEMYLEFGLYDATESYTVVVQLTDTDTGDVTIYGEDGTVFYQSLTASAVQNMLDQTGTSPVDMLDLSNYDVKQKDIDEAQEGLDTLHLTNVQWYTAQMEGRVDVTITSTIP